MQVADEVAAVAVVSFEEFAVAAVVRDEAAPKAVGVAQSQPRRQLMAHCVGLRLLLLIGWGLHLWHWLMLAGLSSHG